MDNNQKLYTRGILQRLVLLFVLVVGVVVWQRQFFYDVYIGNQITTAGWIINGAIVVLFLMGLSRLTVLFLRYTSEERSINQFVNNIQRGREPAETVASESMIAVRYKMLRELYNRRAPINQSALAAATIAAESSQLSFPKFVNNVLILTGVFGTIVSLSIALLGASDMLGSTAELGGLDKVIHGMSTALSTTMTAILCYFFFGYFYIKLTDTQSSLISRIEQITTTSLMPKFQIQSEIMMRDFTDMVRTTTGLVEQMAHSQVRLNEAIQMLKNLVSDTQTRLGDTEERFKELNAVLREGFRLPEETVEKEKIDK